MAVNFSVYAQHDSTTVRIRKNSFFVEYGGNAVEDGVRFKQRFSISYDRILMGNKLVKSTVRIGYAIPTKNYYFPIPYDRSEHIIPIMMNLLIGKKNFYFEIGIGVDFVLFNSDHAHVYEAFTSVFGLRYQNYEKGIMARIGVTPTIGNLNGTYSTGSYPYLGSLFGISIGYSFFKK